MNDGLVNKLSVYDAARKVHPNVFSQFKGIYKGKNVALVATGPTLKEYLPIKGCINIGVNRAFQFDQVKFMYLFLQDFSKENKKQIESFMDYECQKFLGIQAEYYNPTCIVPKQFLVRENVFPYYVLPPNKEMPEFAYDISINPLGDYWSIVFPAMQFILWTHPKRIYLIGCDCSNNGYYDNHMNKLAVGNVCYGWAKMKDFIRLYYPDIEIVSVNPVNLKGLFVDWYQNTSKESDISSGSLFDDNFGRIKDFRVSKYIRYGILSKILLGSLRNKYKEKFKEMESLYNLLKK